MALHTTAARTVDDQTYTIVSTQPWRYPDIPVTTLHLSCASDVYIEGAGKNYAGFVLYAHKGQTSWTLNGRQCRTGYIVVQDTGSRAVQRYIGKTEGIVHGAVYKNVFGEDIDKDTVGEAFSVMSGEFEWKSGTFNRRTSYYHDGSFEISSIAKECIFKVMLVWMKVGSNKHYLPCTRNFYVEDLVGKCTCHYE